MALLKTIKQPDGVTTTYHRILFVDSMINSHVSVVVLSYIDEEGRNNDSPDSRAYKVSTTYELDYVKNMTVEKAYRYLKTLPEFEGATDVLDDIDGTDEVSGEEFLSMIEEVM